MKAGSGSFAKDGIAETSKRTIAIEKKMEKKMGLRQGWTFERFIP